MTENESRKTVGQRIKTIQDQVRRQIESLRVLPDWQCIDFPECGAPGAVTYRRGNMQVFLQPPCTLPATWGKVFPEPSVPQVADRWSIWRTDRITGRTLSSKLDVPFDVAAEYLRELGVVGA